MSGFVPWKLEWGCEALERLGFRMEPPKEDPRRDDPRLSAAVRRGLQSARVSEGARDDAQVRLAAWRYDRIEDALDAGRELARAGLTAEVSHWGTMGPSIFLIDLSGGGAGLLEQIVDRLLQYDAVPEP
jgi:hypothetical protein